ncbi:tripartite tricarboxylate transporter permease [Pararhodobacter marinus]
MMEILNGLSLGLSVAFSVSTLFYCFAGVAVGTLVGVLPGLGGLATIAMLMPLTYHVAAVDALVMLSGIYYGAAYGGSTASILLNLPGTANTAVTCLDGYPMTKQGRAGVALFMTTIASFVGAFIGLVALVGFAPYLLAAARSFSSQEYFSLMVLGLIAASVLSTSSPLKGLAMVTLGLILGLVGTDITSGTNRFTFGSLRLYDGLNLVALAMGMFGVPELIANAGRVRSNIVDSKSITWRSMWPTRDDWKRSTNPMLRGTGIGAVLGALPGTGGLLASFMSYAVEKRLAKDPSRFGNGAIEGIAGPEAANNAAIQTAFIPTLTLGIPGDAVMALMMAAMIIQGIVPGPGLMTQQPDLFWGVCVSFLIGNIMLLILNIPLIGVWVKILAVPYWMLFPAVVIFICVGVYSINYSTFDVFWVMIFGFLGYLLAVLKFEVAPLLLGFILGPLMEEHLRRSMLLSRGSFSTFVERPISASFLAAAALILLWLAYASLRGRARARAAKQHAALSE